jgi:hypothetical protein
MLEKDPKPETQFEVTNIEQLKDYLLKAWPIKDLSSDEAKQKFQEATAQAQKIIEQKGGLTSEDLSTLGFFHKDKGSPNDW